jgi:hypothetical protein
MELEGSLPCSQAPAIIPLPKPYSYGPQILNLFP